MNLIYAKHTNQYHKKGILKKTSSLSGYYQPYKLKSQLPIQPQFLQPLQGSFLYGNSNAGVMKLHELKTRQVELIRIRFKLRSNAGFKFVTKIIGKYFLKLFPKFKIR